MDTSITENTKTAIAVQVDEISVNFAPLRTWSLKTAARHSKAYGDIDGKSGISSLAHPIESMHTLGRTMRAPLQTAHHPPARRPQPTSPPSRGPKKGHHQNTAIRQAPEGFAENSRHRSDWRFSLGTSHKTTAPLCPLKTTPTPSSQRTSPCLILTARRKLKGLI